MRILYVAAYPPLRDGIAAYAVQDVARLRRAGHHVEVLSPGPSAAHHHLDLRGPRGALALAKRVRAYDRLVVQFHPDFFFPVPCSDGMRAATASALAAAFRAARSTEVVVHEVDYRHGSGRSPGAVASRAMWRAVDRVLVHTPEEQARFLGAFRVRSERVELTAHGAAFVPRTSHDRTTARVSLGIPLDRTVFLAIGFIQPHKGFDRAVRAFQGIDPERAWLFVVGSLRVEDAAYVAYLDELRALVDDTPGVTLEEGFVSDELFDRWLVAADIVVLPYRHIWSSGVLERAALFETPVIVTAVGGLRDQVAGRDGVTVVEDDRGLAAAMRKAAGMDVAVGSSPWPQDGPELRERLQAEVVARAARRRGGPVRRLGGSARGRHASASAAVRSLPPLSPPAPVSERWGVTPVKRVVRRAAGWMLDPVYWQVNALRDRTIRALDDVDASRPEDTGEGAEDHS